mgnify:CR=1 FL=1
MIGLNDKALFLKDFIFTIADHNINVVENILKFNHTQLKEYNQLLDYFKNTHESNVPSSEKGKALETIVRFIFEETGIFDVFPNICTSSNEIDILVRLNKHGNFFKRQGLIDFEDYLIAECKNYNNKISATWVGKFYCLMKYTSNNLGIIFSYYGLSGKNWNDAVGLTKKIKLMEKDTFIIDFNYNDFVQLSKGKDFVTIIKNKMFNLKNDTSIQNFLSPHPNQEKFKQIIDNFTHSNVNN